MEEGKGTSMSCHNLHSIYLGQTEHECPIQLKTVSDPERKVGVYTCPMGNFSYHVAQLLTTGLEYAEKLARKLGAWVLLARDAWMGTHYQLFPKLIYGAAAVTHSLE
jgi:hypothetical protein